LKITPEDPFVHYHIGALAELVSSNVNESAVALHHLLKAAELEIANSLQGFPLRLIPSHYALRAAAKVYERYGNIENSIDTLQRALALYPSAMVAHDLAVLYFRSWRINETIQFIEESLAIVGSAEEHLQCVRDAAVMYARLGFRLLSEECFLEALRLQPGILS